jgi:hypothetical protein
MEPLLKYLETYNPKPQYAQTAVGGNWEDAVQIDFSNETSNNNLSFGEADTSIAGEIFYRLNDNRAVFFGVRYSNSLKVNSPDEFLARFSKVLKNAPNQSFREILAELGQQLNDNTLTFIGSGANYVELGVEGYWKSYGSRVLRKSGEPSITEETIKKLLGDNDNLLKNNKNHIALEFAVSNPEYWFGVQVSKEVNGQYVTDLESVVMLSNMV